MRVLLVSHLYPPEHTGGTELYTAELAREIAGHGHEVAVFTTGKDVSKPDLELFERAHAGIAVHELVNNLYYRDFAETWRRPEVDALFGRFLERWRPDVVHFQHLMYLSAGCLEEARRREASVLLTLHDYWLECPRFGQLVHADGGLCERVDHGRCGTCLARFKWRQSALERRTGKLLALVRRASGIDLSGVARSLAARGAGSVGRRAREPDPGLESRYTELARQRSMELRALAGRTVDRFVSPSRFLAERLIAHGLDRARMRVVPTGIDAARFAPRAREHGERVAIRFFGTLVPLKGAHVLLEAWGRLSEEERARGELVLYGSRSHAPEYQSRLDRLAEESGARIGGLLGRDELARELSRTDLCVVPSTWFENRPLIVLEALATRTPLLVSDAGGLAELVEEAVTGWRCPMGDASALAARLRAILGEPRALAELHARPIRLPTWKETGEAMLALYEEVRAERER